MVSLATRVPEETINKIRTETNIVDVVSQYVQLKKRGKNYFGFCPFHDERTPSFSVTDEKQIFHCFSCGRGGNVFSFLMEVEGIGFIEAVQKTAEIAEIPLDLQLNDSEPRSPLHNKKEQLIAIHEAAVAFYHQVLMNTVTGEGALAYLKQRGFTEELLKEFQVGFSPPNKLTTQQILAKQNFNHEALQESGIFTDRSENGELLDRFAARIMFPLRDEKGRTVAFSGRMLPNEEPVQSDYHEAKYLNSPETIIFSKRNFLFNLDKARKEMRKTSEVVLFEGYMDVISAFQAGVTNGVASMGTSLTDEQIRMMNKLVDSVVISYDGDRAGIEATKKAIDLLQVGNRFDLSVFPLPPGMDPDDYIQAKGAESFRHAITTQRETIFHFQGRYLRSQINMDSEKDRIHYLEQMVKLLVKVDSIIEREMYLNELAQDFDMDSTVLKKQLQEYQKDHLKNQTKERKQAKEEPIVTTIQQPSVKKKYNLIEVSERQLLYRLFHHEEAWSYLRELSPDFHFTDETHQTIYMLYDAFHDEMEEVGHIDAFLDWVKDVKLIEKVIEIEMIDLQADLSPQEITDLIGVIGSQSLHIRIQQKKNAIKEANRDQDKERAKQLLEEYIVLTRELKQTKK